MDRFYKANEEVTLRFYQMPKVLFNNQKYKGLSLGAKAMYSILRDRQDLSIKNNWVDEEGNIFLTFSVEKLCEILEVSNKTVISLKKELVKYGLLIDKRMGQGYSNRIYVLKPETVDIALKCKKYTSKDVDSTLLEVKNLHTNDTEFSDTEFSDTQSVSHEKVKKEKKPIGPTDRQTENMENIFQKIKDELDINGIKIAHPHDIKLIDEIILNIFDMYFSDYTTIQGQNKPKELIRAVIMKLTYFHLEELINKYKKLSTTVKITNPKAYIQTMIYNIAFESDLSITNDVKYNWG